MAVFVCVIGCKNGQKTTSHQTPHWRMLCVPHNTWPRPLSSYTLEQQQGFLYKHLAPDWSELDSKANLLLWDTASSLSVVLATWGTGGRFEGSLEELPWRRFEHVWCLMMMLKAQKSVILLNNSLSVIFSLVVCLGEMLFFCSSSPCNALWKKDAFLQYLRKTFNSIFIFRCRQ